jgi:hypothetical protein
MNAVWSAEVRNQVFGFIEAKYLLKGRNITTHFVSLWIRCLTARPLYFVVALQTAKGAESRNMKTTTLPIEYPMNLPPLRLTLLLIPFALASFALSPQAQAVCQEGCDMMNNTFLGMDALSHTTGNDNTAIGDQALTSNTTGALNTATGSTALLSNTTGYDNTASGFNALYRNTSGYNNTAIGIYALTLNTIGHDNIALGVFAGSNLTTGSNNIHIGHSGVVGESNTIHIGKGGVQTKTVIAGIRGTAISGGIAVFIDSNGRLGTTTSSARFKQQITPMDTTSEAVLALKPVTFRYKHELDPDGIPQFGLVAEEVEKVNPDLVAHDEQGKPYTVRYEAVNAMLLNEFLKEHRKVERLESTVAKQQMTAAKQEATIAQLENQIGALTAGLQKVTAQIELSKAAPRTVNNP